MNFTRRAFIAGMAAVPFVPKSEPVLQGSIAETAGFSFAGEAAPARLTVAHLLAAKKILSENNVAGPYEVHMLGIDGRAVRRLLS